MQDEYLGRVTQLVHHVFAEPPVTRIERVWEGVSTYVYRLRRADEVLYLRVLPEAGASFAPEARVHQWLRAQGVSVPEVIFYEPRDSALQRSVMVTCEIPGKAVGDWSFTRGIEQILKQAGEDLARMNQITVEGFGWVQRHASNVTRLQGEFATCWAWIEEDTQFDRAALERGRLFEPAEVQALPEVLDRCRTRFTEEQAYLAHGDFDVSHIYHEEGVYTGIIDLGEIRGTCALYDLGHFDIENHALLPYLLEGYGNVAALPTDYRERIELLGTFIALRRIGRSLMKGGDAYPPDVAAVKRYLQVVVAEKGAEGGVPLGY